MKRMSYFLSCIVLLAACSKSDDVGPGVTEERGYVTGLVKDAAGKPLRSTKIIVDHSIFYNSNISTFSDANGKYRLKVPTGSWFAFAQHQVNYHGKFYTLYLHPENPEGFGEEGGVRNFEWRMTGQRPEPLGGEYGGTVTLDNFPGVYIDEKRIEFTFVPDGPLMDKSVGQTLKLNGENLKDVPLGRYQVSATYEGRPVKLRNWNSDEEFQTNFRLDFRPSIPAQCDNCAKLEYYFEQ